MRVTLVATPAKKVTAKLGEAIATTEPTFVSEWADHTDTAFTEGSSDGSFSGATDVDVIATPAASTRRVCRAIAVYNEDTIAHRVFIQVDNAGSKRTILDEDLGPGEYLSFKDGVKYPEITTYNGVMGIAGSGTSVATTGTVQFANGNNVTFGLAGNTMTASASFSQSNQPRVVSLNGSSDSLSIAGSDFIGISNTDSTILIRNLLSAATTIFPVGTSFTLGSQSSCFALADHQHAGVPVAGISGGNTSGTSGTYYGSFMMAGGDNITLSAVTGAGGQTVTISGPNTVAQTVQPAVGSLNGSSGTMSLSGDGTYISISNNASTMSVRLALSTATTIRPVATANSSGSQSSYFALADHAHAGVPVAGISGGNTSGTSGTYLGSLMFAGGNNITLSAVTGAGGQTVTISGPNTVAQSHQPAIDAAGISGGNTSNTSGTFTGSLMFAGGNNITLSAVTGAGGQTVTISGVNTVAQSVQPAVGSLNGSSGTMSVSGDGTYISISNNNSTMSVRLALSTATTVRPVGTAGSTGSQSSYFALADHAHAGIPVAGISGGNTSNTSGTYLGSFMLAGGNNVTLSAVTGAGGQTVTISGVNTVAQSIQPAVGSLNGSSGTMSLSGDGTYISISNNNSTMSVRLALSTATTIRPVATANSTGSQSSYFALADHAHAGIPVAGISGGNTSGTSGTYLGSFVLAGGNNVTLSAVTGAGGQTVTISGPNTVAQSVQPAVGSLNGSSGTMSVSGDGTYISISNNNSTMSVRLALSTATTVRPVATANSTGSQSSYFALADHAHAGVPVAGISGGNTSNTSGTYLGSFMLAGGNNVTLSAVTGAGGQTVTISGPNTVAQSVQPAVGSLNGSSGTMSLSGDGTYISISNNNSTMSVRLALSTATTVRPVATANSTGSQSSYFALADHAHAGVPVAGISGGNTSGTSGTYLGSFMLAGGNNITLSAVTGAGGQTVTISGGAGGAGIPAAGVSGGNTSGTSGTYTGSIMFAGGNNITLSVQTAVGGHQTITISGGAGGGGVGQLNGSAGTMSVSGDGTYISISNNASTMSIRLALSTATTIRPVGTANSTGSQSSHFALADHAHAGVPVAGISGGNTSGTSGTYLGSFMLAGGNNITLSAVTGAGGQTVTISGGAGGAGIPAAGVSGGNTSGTSGTFTGSIMFAGGNNITLSVNTAAGGHQTVTISAGAGGGGIAGLAAVGIATTYTSGTVYISAQANITLNTSVDGGSQYIRISAPAPGGGAAFTYSGFYPYRAEQVVVGQIGQATIHVTPHYGFPNVVFDRVAFDVLASNTSNTTGSATVSMWLGFYTKNASTLSLYASSSTSQGLTFSGTVRNSLMSGHRIMTMGWTTTITANDYWLAIVSRTTSGGANMTISQFVASQMASAYSGILGVASAATGQSRLGGGIFGTTSAGLPNSMGFTGISGTTSVHLRPPVFALMSGTV